MVGQIAAQPPVRPSFFRRPDVIARRRRVVAADVPHHLGELAFILASLRRLHRPRPHDRRRDVFLRPGVDQVGADRLQHERLQPVGPNRRVRAGRIVAEFQRAEVALVEPPALAVVVVLAMHAAHPPAAVPAGHHPGQRVPARHPVVLPLVAGEDALHLLKLLGRNDQVVGVPDDNQPSVARVQNLARESTPDRRVPAWVGLTSKPNVLL